MPDRGHPGSGVGVCVLGDLRSHWRYRLERRLEGWGGYPTGCADADVVLVVVEPDHLIARAENRQFQDAVTLALDRHRAGAAVVVPVLVARAEMPSEAELPAALRPLIYLQALQVQNDRDMRDLPGRVWDLAHTGTAWQPAYGVLASLTSLGWLSVRAERRGRYVLRHEDHCDYRIVVTAPDGDAVIQEIVPTVRSLGFPVWQDRAAFPLTVGDAGVSGPSAALLYAAQNPGERLRATVRLVAESDSLWLGRLKHALSRVAEVTKENRTGDLVVVLVDPGCLQPGSPSGSRLGADLSSALRAQRAAVPIVPVLSDGAELPPESDLVPGLRPLANRDPVHLQDGADVVDAVSVIVGRRSVSTNQGVFVSYRRGDTEAWAHALARHLAGRIGTDNVFIDVASEQLGRDYREQINSALSSARDVVVMVGSRFFEEGDEGRRRIDEPDDWVRAEVAAALTPGKHVCLVLVGDAAKPRRTQLPKDIRSLAEVTSVQRVRAGRDLARVGDAILSQRRSLGRPTSTIAPFLYSPSAPGPEAYALAARAVLADLARLGWLPVRARKQDDRWGGRWGGRYVIHSQQHPRYRMILLVKTADVVLEERSHSIRRAGFPAWVSRAKFSFSPRRPGKADLLQTPAPVLEVALDPDTYLDIVGRHDLGHFGRRVSSQDRAALTYGDEWLRSPEQVEKRQHEDGRTARLGHRLTPLERIGWFDDEPSEREVRGIAFHPDGERVALAHQSEIRWRSTRDGSPAGTWASPGLLQAIASSSTGRLAGVSVCQFRDFVYGGRLAVWDAGGDLLVNRPIPDSVWTRLKTWVRVVGEAAFHGLAIDPTGERVAGVTPSGVWAYRLKEDVFRQWRNDWPEGGDVAFLRPIAQLAVVGGGCLHRIDADTLEVIARSGKPRPDRTEPGDESDAADPLGCSIGMSLSPSPSGALLVVATDAGRVAQFDTDRLALLCSEQWFASSTQVEVVRYSPDSRWIAAIAGPSLVVGRADDLKPVFEAHVADDDDSWRSVGPLPQVAWSPDSSMIATNTDSGVWQFWQLPGRGGPTRQAPDAARGSVASEKAPENVDSPTRRPPALSQPPAAGSWVSRFEGSLAERLVMVGVALVVGALLAIVTQVMIRQGAPRLASTLEQGWQSWVPARVADLPGWVAGVASLVVLVALVVLGVTRALSVQCLDVWDSLNASFTSGVGGFLASGVWAYASIASLTVPQMAWWGAGFVMATTVGVIGSIAADDLRCGAG